ncbi:MAG: DUF4258 domain-containing protein [Lacibacter sp.]
MNLKKALPYLFLLLLLVVLVFVRTCKSSSNKTDNEKTKKRTEDVRNNDDQKTDNQKNNLDVFRDPSADYYFTKHARCRMKCRHITQEEVKEIVRKADVNYNKSELDAAQGPKYAMEGYTSGERQHVRIIVAPKQRHLTIVTVIDLDYDWECPSCK